MRTATLGELCQFEYGRSLPAKDRANGDVHVFGSNGVVGAHTVALTSGETIVIGRKGSVGEVNYSTAPCWPIDTTYFVDANGTSEDLRWLFYALKQLDLPGLNKATGVPGLNRNDAYMQKVVVPPLPEQRRIAAILDQADALRRLRRQSLSRLSDLGQAIFFEMFGDPARNPKGFPVGTIRDLLAEAKYGTAAKANLNGEGLPILRMGNLTYDGRIDLTDLKHVKLSERDFPKYTTRPGDLLFNRTNSKELVGKTAVVEQTEPLAIAGYLIRARTNEKGNPHYISAYLNSTQGKAILRNMCKNIVGMANINAQEMQDIPIAMPPLELQDQFARRLGTIKSQRSQMSLAIQTSESLFASLQHRAFRGEL